jgi:hypothetical protein
MHPAVSDAQRRHGYRFFGNYKADPVFSNVIVSLTTLASMKTIPVLFFVLK